MKISPETPTDLESNRFWDRLNDYYWELVVELVRSLLFFNILIAEINKTVPKIICNVLTPIPISIHTNTLRSYNKNNSANVR